jgi:hypothetical protein
MNLDVVIMRLRALVPMFNGNVAGAAEFEHGVQDQVWLTPPAAYVIPLEDQVEPNDQLIGIRQISTERIGIIAIYPNAAGVAAGDRRGQSITDLIEPTKYQLHAALINWRPNSSVENPGLVLPTDPGANRSVRGMDYGGYKLVRPELGRFFYQFDFTLQVELTDADGSWPALPNSLEQMHISWVKFYQTGQATSGDPLTKDLADAMFNMPPDDRTP